MNQKDMKELGFTDYFADQAALYGDMYAGRVFSQSRDLYHVMCTGGELMARVSGRFRYEASLPADFPAVGDFVMLDRETNRDGDAVIHHVLPRKSAFVRKAAGTSNDEQIVASNIDTVFICMALNNDFNLRRLERYLAIGWDSGAVPVTVLTKSDLCDDLEQRLCDVNTVALGSDILITSSVNRDGYEQLAQYITGGQTVAFIGSSGVGKSTLINGLIGEKRMDTNGLRNDDKGRHTTTRRELIPLKDGGMVIDTPGMRELGLENADLSRTFTDIEEYAKACRFRDCTHNSEPGCAVQQAIADGVLSAERLQSYKKLKKEARYEGLGSRQIETMKINEMFREVGGMKNARKFAKSKNKRRGY
ncbi:ribosome small subunit-dependent GTPase A [Ruminococcus gauvreauii]|uniref:Small ribosomal subunit biogenesis GTPase RsgA n=1 Tax=Ruminococcus gauvreauii TaxID=438033 RepID=A0ABY5VGL2_9FIRM|nr:ribosome small subunit-dependent GTPase A [Ruminococcus gauvreauii]UWP59407.1 ribosome small subunit-dependent GTPase A [Ruminococcus gauvreauii]